MKKLLLFLSVAVLFGGSMIMASGKSTTVVTEDNGKYSKANYPVKVHHDALHFDCSTCHGDGPKSQYTKLGTKDCLECHQSYSKLAERTQHLGYDDNIHASPHYPDMDCDLCHSSHKESKNYCVMCHSQESMKKLLVP